MLLVAPTNALPHKKLAKSQALERDDEWKAFVMERIEKQDRKNKKQDATNKKLEATIKKQEATVKEQDATIKELVAQNKELVAQNKELVARLEVSRGVSL